MCRMFSGDKLSAWGSVSFRTRSCARFLSRAQVMVSSALQNVSALFSFCLAHGVPLNICWGLGSDVNPLWFQILIFTFDTSCSEFRESVKRQKQKDFKRRHVGAIVGQNKSMKKEIEKGVNSSERYEFSSQNVWIYELINVETCKKKWHNY